MFCGRNEVFCHQCAERSRHRDAATVVTEKQRQPRRWLMQMREVIAGERNTTAPMEFATCAFELGKNQRDDRFEMTKFAGTGRLAEWSSPTHDQAAIVIAAVIEQQPARVRGDLAFRQHA